MDRIRHQLFLTKELSERLEVLAEKPGATKSAILVDALTAWLNRRAASELEHKFGTRLDRMTNAIGRIERDGYWRLGRLLSQSRISSSRHRILPLPMSHGAGSLPSRVMRNMEVLLSPSNAQICLLVTIPGMG